MGAIFGSALFGEVLKAFFGSLFGSLFNFLDKKEQDQTHEALGASKVVAKTNQEASDAERRAAAVIQPDVVDFVNSAKSGQF